ncbi:DUF427 domain-containing protein [Halomonas salinarum]|uniref:DUF427 domain-containing protein n=1 Tax=Halomonas salinarum TaxID=1158993 RepID=UPI002473B871|nr:DUF427 domain-containing protein [Halomonas salinarum]
MRPLAGDSLVADFRNGIEMRERGYPSRHYIPKKDVDMSKLSVSTTVSHYPFKGDIIYYSPSDIADVAWSYELLLDDMQAIDTDKATEQVE